MLGFCAELPLTILATLAKFAVFFCSCCCAATAAACRPSCCDSSLPFLLVVPAGDVNDGDLVREETGDELLVFGDTLARTAAV